MGDQKCRRLGLCILGLNTSLAPATCRQTGSQRPQEGAGAGGHLRVQRTPAVRLACGEARRNRPDAGGVVSAGLNGAAATISLSDRRQAAALSGVRSGPSGLCGRGMHGATCLRECVCGPWGEDDFSLLTQGHPAAHQVTSCGDSVWFGEVREWPDSPGMVQPDLCPSDKA